MHLWHALSGCPACSLNLAEVQDHLLGDLLDHEQAVSLGLKLQFGGEL